MSLLDRIEACRRWEPSRFRPFRVAGQEVGWITAEMTERLKAFPTVFTVGSASVDLASALGDFKSRSAAVAEVLGELREQGLIKGWRDEPYPVGTDFYAPPLLQMERAAVPLFGVRAYGVHVNGFIGEGADMKLWVAKRSRTKQTAPGKLDHLVAGGQPLGLGLMENVIKECGEEAGMPESLGRTARPAGFVSYITERAEGLRNDICFVFDIALPADFTPVNADGDTDDFKFNVALVNIDFLVRRGFLSPDTPGYVEIVEGLRLQAPGL